MNVINIQVFAKGIVDILVGILFLVLAKSAQDKFGVPFELSYWALPMTVSGLAVFISSGIKLPKINI